MWYNRVVADLGRIPDFIAYYENELQDAKKDCKLAGNVERNIKELPGLTEHRYNQLQEIEAVLVAGYASDPHVRSVEHMA